MADAIGDGDKHSVGDGMRSLDGAPSIMLGGAVLLLLRRVPTDSCRIEKDLGALQRGEARSFRVPLVPTDERADLAHLSIEGLEAKVTGREIELFVIERIVRDMHLAVDALEGSVGVEHGGGVVIEAAR